ncbi:MULTISPECIES: hypothetical protein [Enterobacter cloacae complex]|uniref:hypothetical protein n=1 Tax=Enterobacter cloacae complex TaxID=354276 RepID=UPI0006524902|nr:MULTISPECIES: hypothetical protein [Enterobacter cloacae complex]KLW33729.1 hypothetical protein SK51_02220 [Enterobacter sp. MGH85]MBE2980960.1 hypothetical protein [Enterobacter hormaechei]MCU3681467.1 hypothetical protein [Enterobacter hormaechei subsp. hoffmannii]MCU3695759.1 hypothetical protein [Enterobacter hormaechei subsp. hoffmannii]
MTQDQQTILMFKGLIASLPEESQSKVKKAEQAIREVLATYPDGEATIALGLIGAELQCDELEHVTK